MSKYGFCITDKGYRLIAKLMSGKQLSLSRIMVGSGTCPDDVDMHGVTDLFEPVAAATSTEPTYEDAYVRMTVEYRSDLNGGLDHGFWLSEYGIYAFDPDDGEVLIYYGCLGGYPQWVGPKSDTGIDVRRFPVCIVIGEGLGVTVDWKCEAWMTADDVKAFTSATILPEFISAAEDLIAAHNEDPEAHHSIQNRVTDVDARLALLELMYNTSVTGNPFTVTFATLDDVVVEGVWNKSAKRIEF